MYYVLIMIMSYYFYADFYIDFNKFQAPVLGFTGIPGRECHRCRNWAPKFNLVGHARMYGG